jgi:CubicO group peptidase (beta-lactamase class C family)
MIKLFWGLLVSLFMNVGANAQTIEGSWQGTIKADGVELRLRLHVTKDEKGTLKATFDSIDQGARGLPISAISLNDSTLNFELQEISGSYEGKVNADYTRISGTWNQGGRSFPLEFTRITVLEETKKKTPKPSDIDGDWVGGPSELRFVLCIITYEDGMTAEVDSPDTDAFGIPITTITRDGADLKFEVKSIAGSYEGKINPELTTISGTWKQGGDSEPLVLKRTSAVPHRLTLKKQPDVKPLQSMPTVDQIIDKYVQAIGGVTAHRKLTSQVIKATLVIEGSDATASIETYKQAPNKAVNISQVKLGNGVEFEVSRGFNGAVGWAFNPNDGGFRELSGTELATEKRNFEFYWKIKLKEFYPKMALAGQALVGDRLAYCIEATPPEGDPIKLYFEAQTGLLVRLDSIYETATKSKIPFETYFEDYREVDGVKLPFTIRQPKKIYTYKVNEVRHNVPIDEARFKYSDPALVAATTDEYIQNEMKKRRIPGLALVVIKNGEIIKMNGYGVANLEDDAPVTPDTVFELASVTKQFTATAIMRLVEQDKLKLDDPIIRLLPSVPNKWNGITIRHLLTHTSGLAGGFEESLENKKDLTTAEVFQSVAKVPMNSEPGEQFNYSDPGYFLLGMIIEKASGRRYRDFLAEQFFRPLEMSSTSVIDQWAVVRHRAAGYTLRNGQIANIRRIWQDELPSHWGALSTVKDLAKWDTALEAGRVVKESSLAEMWASAKLKSGGLHPYGFGWKLERMVSHRVITHAGMSGTEYTRLPDDKLTVIVLTNLGYGYGDPVNSWGLTKGIALRYLSGRP